MNDHELAWHFKESIKATYNNDVYVQEQGSATQAVQILCEGCEFGPTTLRYARRQIERRNGQALNLTAYPCGVICEANHIEMAS